MKSILKFGLATIAVALFVAAGTSKNDNQKHHGRDFVIDVACDCRTYTANGVDPSTGTEVRGSTFIVNGKIFPGGTIPSGDGFDLDAVPGIGTWVCRGTYNFSWPEILAEAAPHVSTVQQYLFSRDGMLDAPNALMSEGQEGGTTVQRVVMGGTGRYRGFIGEVKEEELGLNKTGCPNIRFTFNIRKED